jgi:hypothetical protein
VGRPAELLAGAQAPVIDPATTWTPENVVAVINAGLTLLATVAGAAAAWAAFLAVREQRRSRHEEERHRTAEWNVSRYRAIVVDVALEETRSFLADATKVLRAAAIELDGLDQQRSLLPITAFDECIRRVIGEFNALFYDLKTRLDHVAMAWGSDALAEAISTALLDLQDKATVALSQVSVAGAHRPKVDAIVSEGAARVLQIVADAEVALIEDATSQQLVPTAENKNA